MGSPMHATSPPSPLPRPTDPRTLARNTQDRLNRWLEGSVETSSPEIIMAGNPNKTTSPYLYGTAYDAHTEMSTQALNSKSVMEGLKSILLNHTNLYDELRAKSA